MKHDVLRYLRCFESASRLLSFTNAAEELGITQSAVSHQIKELSLRCGFALFERRGNALALTDKGVLYAETVRNGLGLLENGLSQLQADNDRTDIFIHCDPVLANKWLLPRLDRLEAQCLSSTLKLVSVGDANGADVVIGFEEIIRYETISVDHDVCLPVCSPDIFEVGSNSLSSPEFQSETAITLGEGTRERQFGMSWSDWQAHFGNDTTPRGDVENHATVELALQAAVHGRGVALLRQCVADDDLRAGRLVVASQQKLPTNVPIFFSIDPDGPNAALCQRLRDWLINEMNTVSSS
ncbi:LysR family transcriptional regulator [Candidatus Rhodobacter oscarellae]|uniref:LysR family transcriptional regulator n=1 Tax=Candidatus Rhodobacter oscarellae TaxID=1675527 RepID=UPI0009E26619|nr:LysR family transcriptional regulator [Candidatus Rhodobacter lobularis]